jgi:DNA-binding NarL/FixJ family response regulator
VPTILIATDADWVHAEVEAALGGSSNVVERVRAGVDVLPAVERLDPDLVIVDLQIGNMGGMATVMDLRLEEGSGRIDRRAVLMVLDREADVFLARRCGADGWLIKPLDAFRLRKAALELLGGGTYHEGVADEGLLPT